MVQSILGNDLLTSIIAFILVLIPAVIIHELGHFLAAKAVGITILEFGIGMPPKMLRLFRLGGTDYTLNWLPLGGFVRPIGEGIVSQGGDSETESDRAEAIRRGIQNPKSVYEASPLQRIVFMAAGSVANFMMAFALLMLVAMLGLPEIVGARILVTDIAAESAFAGSGLQVNDSIELVNGSSFTSRAQFEELLQNQSGQVELGVRRAGETALITVVSDVTRISDDIDTSLHPLVADISQNSPAMEAGIEPGDLVLAFNGQIINTFNQLRAATQENGGEPIALTILRDGAQREIVLTPRLDETDQQWRMGLVFASASQDGSFDQMNATWNRGAGLIYVDGIPMERLQPQPLSVAIPYAWDQMGFVLNTIISLPAQLLQGTVDPNLARPVGPAGIGQLGGFVLEQSVTNDRPGQFLQFIALVSLSLGLTNLLPIPALDGGRILFVLIELLRGRPISPEREGMVHLVGLVILLSLMVLVTFNDLLNPITNALP
jgi:regulator of sigma E protease